MKQAVIMLGFIELTKWLYVLVLREIQDDLPGETQELLESALFLAGMFSLVDVLLGCGISDVLKQIPLSDQVNETLTGHTTASTPYLELMVGTDIVDWNVIGEKTQELGLDAEMVKIIYENACLWTGEMNQVGGKPAKT